MNQYCIYLLSKNDALLVKYIYKNIDEKSRPDGRLEVFFL